MAKITKILALTLTLNLIALPLLTVHGKKTNVQTDKQAEVPSREAEKQDDLSEEPEIATVGQGKGAVVKKTQPTVQTHIQTEQPGKKTQKSAGKTVNSGEKKKVQRVIDTTNIEKLKMEQEEIGLYNYKFKLVVENGMTLPTSCTACVIFGKNSGTCCEDSTDASKNDCLEKTFNNLYAGKVYKVNFCDSETNEKLFSHTFETKNIPRLKESTFKDGEKTFTYKLEYEKDEDAPKKCMAITRNVADNGYRQLECQVDNTDCSCTSGTYKLPDDLKDPVIGIVDSFNSILYHFNKNGPVPNDPSFYKFKVTNKRSNSVTYSMSEYYPDITDDTTCEFKNLANSTFLKCQKDDKTVTDGCICKEGNLVELLPFTKYDVEIKNNNEKLLYKKISFKTARILRELEPIIGLKNFKYILKDVQDVDRLPDQCKVCILENTSQKKCCKDVSTHTGAEICSAKQFSEGDMQNFIGKSFKINICDIQGYQISTKVLSMPGEFQSGEFVQTREGLKYNLSFKDDKNPTICKLEIKSSSGDQKINHNCIEPSKCDCSSGEVSLRPNLPGSITITIYDHFNEKILEKNFTLIDLSGHIQTNEPSKAEADKKKAKEEAPKNVKDSNGEETQPDGGKKEVTPPVGGVEGGDTDIDAEVVDSGVNGKENNKPASSTEDDIAKVGVANGQPEGENNGAKEVSMPTLESGSPEGPADSQAATGGPAATTKVVNEPGDSQIAVVTEQPAEGEEESEDDDDDTSDDQGGAIEAGNSTKDNGSEVLKDDQTTNVKLPINPNTVKETSDSNTGAGKKETTSQPDKDNTEVDATDNKDEGDDDEVSVSGKEELSPASASPGVNNKLGGISETGQAKMNTPATPTGVSSEADVRVDVSEPATEVDDSSEDDGDDEDKEDDVVEEDKKVLEEVIKVAKEAKEAADKAKASAEEAKEAVEAVIEAEENLSPELTIPISTDGIEASAATPVNTDDGQGSNGSISKENDPIAIEPKPPIIPNPDGGITTGKGGDKAVNTISNGGSANGSTNDQDKANVPTSGGNDVPTVKPTTTASSNAPNPATNTTTSSVSSSEDVKKPGSDGGDINDQGLSSGAIIGIIVGVMVLAGSVGGISYYMIRIKGRASYV